MVFPHGKQGRSLCSLFFRIGKDETDIEQYYKQNKKEPHPQNKNKPYTVLGLLNGVVNYSEEKYSGTRLLKDM